MIVLANLCPGCLNYHGPRSRDGYTDVIRCDACQTKKPTDAAGVVGGSDWNVVKARRARREKIKLRALKLAE